jgi:Tol biopolymer transport system component
MKYATNYMALTLSALALLLAFVYVPFANAQPSTVKRNGKIAFTSDRDGNREIYLMNPDGTGQVRLTNNNIVDDHPKWSLDGRKIAFLSQIASGAYAIFVMNADGTGKTQVTPVSYQFQFPWPAFDGWSMSWSPDGNHIVFSESVGSQRNLVVVNTDGSNRRNLTSGFYPAWSPDGSKILFLRVTVGFPLSLHTISPDGTNVQEILIQGLPQHYTLIGSPPIWSPDGRKIAFSASDYANSEVYIANPDGSNLQGFTHICGEFVPNGCGANTAMPTWSPNGGTIAYAAWSFGNQSVEIYSLNIGETTATRLTNTTGSNSNPNWQPLAYRATADFDGDGRSDVAVFRPADRVWYLNRSTDGFSATQFGLSSDQITPADFDGDGKTDIAVYREGTWWWMNSSDGTVAAVQFGIAGDLPVPADYTGDGRDELAIYRDGVWWTKDLTNGQISAVHFGLPSDRPVPADYDGDGRVDHAVYRDGVWHMNRSSLGYTAVQFGLPEDRPVVGDYDGDGKADLAVYRSGTWYLLKSTEGFAAYQWGGPTDIPVPADYDGDGLSDVAIFRGGTWWILNSTGSIRVQQFGLADDSPIPVASAYVPQLNSEKGRIS